MKKSLRYIIRHFNDQLSYNTYQNLTPLFIYIIGLLFLIIASVTLDREYTLIYLYKVVGIMASVWLFSLVVLNPEQIFIKHSVLKVNYVPLYIRIMPTIWFQTIVFALSIVVYSAVVSLFVNDWSSGIFTFLYYLILGIILIIPFIILYITIKVKQRLKVNVVIFIILVLVLPILYLPEHLPFWLEGILSLNPFYYVIHGLQLNAIDTSWNVYKIPQDILFFTQMLLIYIWLFSFYNKMKPSLYNDYQNF